MAHKHFYYGIIRKTTVQFLDLFNDIVIARYDKDTGKILKYVKVPILYAPKTKQWYYAEKRRTDGHLQLDKLYPIIGINLENIEFDNERLVNTDHNILSSRNTSHKNGIPFNFKFKVQIAAEYMIDIIQVIENVLPGFKPHYWIRITSDDLNINDETSEYGSESLEFKVVYEGSSLESQVEIDEANYRILLWEMDFNVKAEMFGPEKEFSEIRKVVQNIYVDDDVGAKRNSDTVSLSSAGPEALETLTIATSGVKYDEDAKILFRHEHFEKF